MFDRRVSEPVISDHVPGKKDKKKLGIFKRRGGTQYGALQEEPSGDGLGKKSPLVSDRRKKKAVTSTSSWEGAMANCESPEPLKKAQFSKAASSTKVGKKKPAAVGSDAEGPPKVLRPRRPPPPVPNTQLRSTHVYIDTEEISRRRASGELSPDHDAGGGRDRRSSPHSPPRITGTNKSPELPPDVFEQERPLTTSITSSVTVAATTPAAAASASPSPDSVQKSESMEELLKNLEEFDEVISSQNDLETPEEQRERDFATIPRSELPKLAIQMAEQGERKSRSPSRTPEPVRKLVKPDGDSQPVQNGVSQSPVAPPRRKKSKMSQKLKDRVGVFEGSDEFINASKPVVPSSKPVVPGGKPGVNRPLRTAPKATVSSVPPPKPERDEKKRMKSRLEVMATGRQECSSAPVSRNASPDIADSKLCVCVCVCVIHNMHTTVYTRKYFYR